MDAALSAQLLSGLVPVDFRLLDLRAIESAWGRRFDGIVGFDVLCHTTVEIDYAKKTLTIGGKPSGEALPLTFNHGWSFVKGTIKVPGNEPVTDWFLIDTGSQDVLTAVIGALSAERLLILCCYRPEYVAPWSAEVAARQGLTLAGWTADTNDWRGGSAESMLSAVEPLLSAGAVVLAHDGVGPGALRAGCEETVKLIRPIVAAARMRGLEPVPLEPGQDLPAGNPSSEVVRRAGAHAQGTSRAVHLSRGSRHVST